jgi:hypothetical protein
VNCVGQQSLLSEDSARILCRFGRSFFDGTSLVLGPTLAVFGLLRRDLWKRPGPCALCLREASVAGVFRECPRGTTSRLPAATAFGLHLRDRVRASGSASPGLGAPALRRVRPCGPSDRGRAWLRRTAPPEVLRPSGGITAGVRYPGWAQHRSCPRRRVAPASSTPGLSQAFGGLLLQTARLSCFIQTPPMGFKEHEQLMSACGPDRATLGTVPSWNTSRARKRGQAEPARFRCEKAAKSSDRWQDLPNKPGVGVSLTTRAASSSNGRRARRQACPSGLMTF